MGNRLITGLVICLSAVFIQGVTAQDFNMDSLWKETRKNTIRYNLSNALLFGFDKSIVLGYERLLSPHTSISINVGKSALPKFVGISTDSLVLTKDRKNTGFNASVDFRFYLRKENRYMIPRGLYIGPYYSFTKLDRETQWRTISTTSENVFNVETDLKWHVIGAELGYQFVFWDRVTLDLVLAGPGLAFYNVKARAETNLSDENMAELHEALMQLIQQRFPGFNYVFSDEQLSGNGTVSTTSLGFRYLIQIGYRI